MKRSMLTLAAISSILLFTACGQSGPLYLPGNPQKVEKIPAASPDKEERKEDRGDDSTR